MKFAITFLILLILVAFARTDTADAQCGAFKGTYFKPAAYTFTPSYNHGYGYNHQVYPTYSYNYQTYATSYVPFTYPVFTVGYAYGGGQDLEKELLKLKVELKTLEVQTLKDKLTQPANGTVQPPPPYIPPVKPPLKEQPPVMPPADSSGAKPLQGQAASAATTILVQRCVKCHSDVTGPSSGDGIVLVQGGGIIPMSSDMKLRTIKALSTQSMPKVGAKLSEQETSTVIQALLGL